jgi:hypothetical protein
MDTDHLASLLPLECREKYLAAAAARAAAHAAVVAAQDRLAAVIDARDQRLAVVANRAGSYGGEAALGAEWKAIESDAKEKIERARTAIDTASAAFRRHYFLEEVDSWLRRASGMQLKLSFVPNAERLTGSHAEEVTALREKQQVLADEREKVATAPAPIAEIKGRIDRALAQFANEGCPKIDFLEEAGAAFDFHEMAHAVGAPGEDRSSDGGLRLICWMFQDEIRTKLHKLIDATDHGSGINAEDRRATIAKLDAGRLKLERLEEAHIDAAGAGGLVIERRRDIDPRAFLQIREA